MGERIRQSVDSAKDEANEEINKVHQQLGKY
jgi:hypothetical protein